MGSGDDSIDGDRSADGLPHQAGHGEDSMNR